MVEQHQTITKACCDIESMHYRDTCATVVTAQSTREIIYVDGANHMMETLINSPRRQTLVRTAMKPESNTGTIIEYRPKNYGQVRDPNVCQMQGVSGGSSGGNLALCSRLQT